MGFSRRSFLKKSGLLASGLAISSIPLLTTCKQGAKNTQPFGIQLYTLRDVIADNPRRILKQLSEFGYKQIESYDGPKGIYWGMEHTEFKKYMDDLGMKIISSHVDTSKDFERKVEEAAEIGIKHLIVPWVGAQETLDDFKKIANRFNKQGEIANKAGIKFGYHNHGYTFKKVDGVYPQDILMEQTDPDLVDFQMDIYWVVQAGADPVAWIEKYPNRFVSCHIKDLKKRNGEAESVTLGTGTIDYEPILQKAKPKGMKYFIVEQEAYTGTTPIEAAKDNANYLRELEY